MSEHEEPNTSRLIVTLDGKTLFEQDGVTKVYGESNINGKFTMRATFPPTKRSDLTEPTRTAITNALGGLNHLAPGAGEAAKLGLRISERTAAYTGQIPSTGAEGILEALDVPQNLGNSWFKKIAKGIAGVQPR